MFERVAELLCAFSRSLPLVGPLGLLGVDAGGGFDDRQSAQLVGFGTSGGGLGTVSYTHLTLPTIYSV